MPLRTLSIINFHSYLKTLPANLITFRNLDTLALFNNDLAALPPSLTGLPNLRVLYLDANPLATVLPVVLSLASLQELGVGKTGLSKAELAQLPGLLPNCKVRTQ
jgi:Leucine-rich repeat (LRR) protein